MGNGIHDGEEPFWSTHYPKNDTGMCACMRGASVNYNPDNDDENELGDTDDEEDEAEDEDDDEGSRFQRSDTNHPIRIF